MPQYCVTLERRLRIAKWFEADSDEDAIKRANLISVLTKHEEYETGDVEHDYAVVRDDGVTIDDWA